MLYSFLQFRKGRMCPDRVRMKERVVLQDGSGASQLTVAEMCAGCVPSSTCVRTLEERTSVGARSGSTAALHPEPAASHDTGWERAQKAPARVEHTQPRYHTRALLSREENDCVELGLPNCFSPSCVISVC